MEGFKRKNVSFKEDDPKEMKLYEKLKSLPHGDFSKRTKELWVKELKLKEE